MPFPPSVNHYWRHPTTGKLAGRHLISEAGRRYRDAVREQALLERWGKVPEGMRISVQIDAWMPDRRRRDLDNVLKAALDSITYAGVWDDDSSIDHLSIRRIPTVGGMLKVKIVQQEA
jgi:crossover junction endodeoxyribonuclease RusA